jgi:hypothetical protein
MKVVNVAENAPIMRGSLRVKVPVGKEESRGSPVRVSHPPVSSLGSITELPEGSEQHGLSVGRESYRP